AAPRAATRADHRGPRRARAGGSGSPGRGDRIPARGGGGAGRVTAPASPCTSCLRRASLLGLLSIRIAAELSERRRAVPILALSDEELVEAVGGSLKGAAFRLLETFEPARSHAEAEGPTVAVLGCGADTAYPRTNRALYGRIRHQGAVVSELPPGQPPARWTFPARNRIMAGIARATVVVEAAKRSGSLITAGFAGDLGREVCAVPGRVTSRMA